jgi:hypothetical protein
MPRLALLLLIVAACFALPAAASSNVSGTLWLTASARLHAGTTRPRPPQPGVKEGVVWVEAIPGRLELKLATPPKRWFVLATQPPLPSVCERTDRFDPRVLAVPAGASVEFANRDRLYHSMFSVSGAKRFDLGKMAPGRRDTLEFRRAGVINLHCEIHPEAAGFLVVTPNHAFARPNAAGHFALPRLPAGHYVLHAWHPRMGELELPFDVPRRGAVVLDPSF